jgi:glutathione S-transferase
VWDTLAIAEYLHEKFPEAGMYPKDSLARAHCRSISGEIHSGFQNLRSAMPMNLKARHDSFRLFAGAKPDIERIQQIWTDCLTRYGGPWLFGAAPTVADAMFAPVVTRFVTYAIPLDALCRAYCSTIMEWPLMQQWTAEAAKEPDEMEELDAEF